MQIFSLAGAFNLARTGGLSALLVVPLLLGTKAGAQSRIPVNALPSAPKTEGAAAKAISYQVTGNKAVIKQSDPTSIVSWKSFDIGSAASVKIEQPLPSSVLLNKVEGGAFQNKTVIEGMLSANGRVYIYNPNGIIFGKTATVDVNTLIASTLKFDESRVIGGLLKPGTSAVLAADPAFSGKVPGNIIVEGDGEGSASLKANNGGMLLLAAPTVVNNGSLNAPDGQVIVAAGSKIYLAAPDISQTGTSLRGLLVEVSNDYAAGTLAKDASTGTSLAENGKDGSISVGRGNATMIGYAVNQKGRVSASTSVSLNGSVYLFARDQAVRPDANGTFQATRSGPLILGEGSRTEILPTLDDTSTVPVSTQFNKSDVKLSGLNIELQQDARIIAPGGNVTISAVNLPLNNPANDIIDPRTDSARVDLADGSLIDVSGSTGTRLAMESNVIEVDLRGTELADNVVLRDSSLFGSKVRIDVRKGTPVANVDGWLNLVEHGIGELNTAGGTVSVNADSAIIQRSGSRINVDGGSVEYLSGYVNTTKLVLDDPKLQLNVNDSLIDIGSAKAGVLYSGIKNLPNRPDSLEAGYVQGASAGTVKLSSPIVVMQGELSGKATIGARQRDVAAADHPQGGQLQIGNITAATMDPVTGKARTGSANLFAFAGDLLIANTRTSAKSTQTALPPEVGEPFDISNADQTLLASRFDLDTDTLGSAGFNRISALTSGNITIGSPVTLAPGGKLWLGAGQSGLQNADGTVKPGGAISILAPVTIPGGSLTAAAAGQLLVSSSIASSSTTGDGLQFDLAGRWVNDRAQTAPPLDVNGNPASPVLLKGGSLNLSASQLVVGDNLSVSVSAGAWLDTTAKAAQLGKAGSVTIQAEPIDLANDPAAAKLVIGQGLKLEGYGFSAGGSLKIVGRNVTVGGSSSSINPSDLRLSPSLFQQGGFTAFDIGANVNLTVAATTSSFNPVSQREVISSTIVAPEALSWRMKNDVNLMASGDMAMVAQPYRFDLAGPAGAFVRPAASLTLRALPQLLGSAGRVLVERGAQVNLDPGANLSLFAGRQLTLNGTLEAPAGIITLGLTSNAGAVPFDATRSIWFGSQALVDASGSLQRLFTSGDGVSSGEVLDGGSIRIGNLQNGVLTSAAGYVVAESGSRFNVSGAAGYGLQFRSKGVLSPKRDIGSAGGSIDIRVREGLLFAGSLSGAGGTRSAIGGSLTIALDREEQSPGGYPEEARVLGFAPGTASLNTITSDTASFTSITSSALRPNKPIVVQVFGTGNQSDVELGWFLAGTGTSNQPAGQGLIPTSSFDSGGFGRLTFKSQDVLAFGLGQSDWTLSARDALILDAPAIRSFQNTGTAGITTNAPKLSRTLTLSAPYIQMGSADTRYQSPGASTTGNSTLKVNATTIDLIGNSALQGFGTASLSAAEDIRLVGLPTTDEFLIPTGFSRGSLTVTGNLSLTSAQTYPTTLSDFSLAVAANVVDGVADRNTGTLQFNSNGNAPQQVLSAGGSINAVAPHIVQGGRLVAPFGNITLGNLDDASQPIVTEDIEFRSGSVTSVAGAGLVPFGGVNNGSVATASTWQYSLSDGTLLTIKQDPVTGGLLPERALPEKSIVAQAGTITTAQGSVQDVSGGGELFAYAFTPGKGGSRDVLANNTPGSKTTVFAINPGFRGSVAPVDGEYGRDGGLAPGDSVYLSGMAGLPAGTYTLLPAHYALLPGGYSISVAPGTRDMQAASNTFQLDGSMLISGQLVESGSRGSSGRSSGFIVSSGGVVRNKSEYASFTASSYFADKASASGSVAPQLPIDAGYLAFDARGTGATPLVLEGTMRVGAAATGNSGTLDISAPQIEIVSSRTQNAGDAVRLIAGELTALGADSLMIGGLRNIQGDGARLSVRASKVALSNDPANPLRAPEIIMVAGNSVNLNTGASLQGTGSPTGSSQNLLMNGGSALLRVSGGADAAVNRTDSLARAGVLTIASGATVTAAGAATLDATGGVALNGVLNLGAGASLNFGAPDINLGSDIPPAVAGLKLDSERLVAFSGLSRIALNSYASDIGLYGTMNLGSSATQSIVLKSPGLQAFRTSTDATLGQASFIADNIRLDGIGTRATASPAPATVTHGSLNFTADVIAIGDNAFAIHGFTDTALSGRSLVIALGDTGQLVTGGNMGIAAGRITTASSAAATFKAGGNMSLTTSEPLAESKAASLAAAPAAGGQLRFEAARIDSNVNIAAPSGSIAMVSPESVNINGGSLSVAGTSVKFGTNTSYSPGGTIALIGGSVNVSKDAILDVSATGAAAGLLAVAANAADRRASFRLDGQLKGQAMVGNDGVLPSQGQFQLDADRLDLAFGALNAKLNDAGFIESRQFRARNGDITLINDDTVRAHEIVISADNGNIHVAGSASLDASGAKGGHIALYAAQAADGGNAGRVTLAESARLIARGTSISSSAAGSIGNGGRVVIGTGSADGVSPGGIDGGSSIHLDGGSIDVGGSDSDRNGTVNLRASRLASGNDVAIARINTELRNSAATVIEAYKVYQANTISENPDLAGSNLDASRNGRMYADARDFSANGAAMLQRLTGSATGGNSINSASLSPGIEVRATTGDLTVSVNEFASKAADRGWNLNEWRFAGAPVTLALRAAGNLNIIGSISDGFVKPLNLALAMPDWTLDSGPSASYRLIGGADLGSSNPLAVIAGQGDVRFGFADRTPAFEAPTQDVDGFFQAQSKPWRSTDGTLTWRNPSAAPVTNSDAPVALVRSGTGRIDISAGRNVTLGMAKFFVIDNKLAENEDGNIVGTNQDGKLDALQDIPGKTPVFADSTGHLKSQFIKTESDPSVDGTPLLFDKANSDQTFSVSVYGAQVYTAGSRTAVTANRSFAAPQNSLNTHYGATASARTAAAFGSRGGEITIHASGDITGPNNLSASWFYRNADGEAANVGDPKADPPDPATPAVPGTAVALPATPPLLVNSWLFRQGRTALDANGNAVFEKLQDGTTVNTAWWSRPDYFNQGVATLGGGDLRISAGGNITDISASVATNAYSPGTAPGALVEAGGGDLSVRAGADIRGGAYYVQKGSANLRAFGSIAAGNFVPSSASDGAALNPVLALGDGRFNLTAGRNLSVEAAYNPTMTEQSIYNVVAGNAAFGAVNGEGGGGARWDVNNVNYLSTDSLDYRQKFAQYSLFSTYGSDSAVNLLSIGGRLLLSNKASELALAGSPAIPNDLGNHTSVSTTFSDLYVLAPANFSAAALSGDLISQNGFTLMASPQGQLNLLANGSVRLSNGSTGGILMLDNDPDAMSTRLAPRIPDRTDFNVLNGTASGITAHVLGDLHANDPKPVRIAALNGDIAGDGANPVTISLPKFAQIQAGRDIVDLGFRIQQNNASDVTRIEAGRDFVNTTQANGLSADPSPVRNVITGPGRIDIRAGRNVDLGNGSGVVTRGNLDNPYLTEGGASVNVVAGGAAPDYARLVSWLQQYGSANAVMDLSRGPTDSQRNDLVAYVRSLKPDLVLRPAASDALDDALKGFWQLPEVQQKSFLAAQPQDQWAANLDLIAYVRAQQSDRPLSQRVVTAAAALDAFRVMTEAVQQPLLARNLFVADFMALGEFVWETKLGDAASIPAITNPADRAALAPFKVRSYLNRHPELATPVDMWAYFRQLPSAAQQQFLDSHPAIGTRLDENATQLLQALQAKDIPRLNDAFFATVVEAAKLGALKLDNNQLVRSGDLGSFDAGIASLFPNSGTGSGGDISVFGSQFKTEQGGSIDLFTPIGSVFAGLTLGVSGKSPSTQGIFTIRGGEIRSLVRDDFLVNKGRVFTLGGGDITLVSQQGNIDAGRGAKTASSAPPPLITIDANGEIKVDVSGSISGSGIATLKTRPELPNSDVFPIAPRGIFDAGDAGVRSSGGVEIVAVQVLNGGNIDAKGSVVGSPSASAPIAAPSLGTVAAPGSASPKTEEVTKSLGSPAPSRTSASLSVDVLGYGDGPASAAASALNSLPATGTGVSTSPDASDAGSAIGDPEEPKVNERKE